MKRFLEALTAASAVLIALPAYSAPLPGGYWTEWQLGDFPSDLAFRTYIDNGFGAVKDQEFTKSPGFGLQIAGASSTFSSAQTFEAGVSGNLTAVDILFGPQTGTSADAMVEIRRTGGPLGGPLSGDDNLLAWAIYPGSLGSEPVRFISFDISGFGLVVAAGDKLAIVLTAPDEHGAQWLWTGQSNTDGSNEKLYAGGDFFYSYYTFPGIPEPGSLALLGLGLAGLGLSRRRKAS